MKQAIRSLHKSWAPYLSDQWSQEYFVQLSQFISQQGKTEDVFPAPTHYFTAFNHTPFHKVKVVILGQDPYHGKGQAHGLSFSVPEGVKVPPSLKNIYKELSSDLKIPAPESGDLTNWAQQGVLLLNATLTVNSGQAGSHQKRGWEQFTDHVFEVLNLHHKNLVFILWGSYAQKKGKNIDKKKHLVLEAPHPSPLSVYRGFWGCKHFSKTNKYLQKMGATPINWAKTKA